MELLTRITGHRTTEIVEKYYNQAKREQARRVFLAAMPLAIAGEAKPVASEGAAPSGDVLEMVALPGELAGLLAGATATDLKKIATMLKKGGKAGKGKL